MDLGVKLRARLLTTVPDSTSLRFVLLGTLTRQSSDKGSKGERHIIVHIDFDSLSKRKCGEKDMERWYARTMGGEPDCLMGHKVGSRFHSLLSLSVANRFRLFSAMVSEEKSRCRLRYRREVQGPCGTRGELCLHS